MPYPRRLIVLAWFLAPLVASAGCSVINAYDDIKPLVSGSMDASIDTHKDALTPEDHTRADEGTDGKTTDVETTDTSEEVDAEDAGTTDSGPQGGAIVVSGEGTSSDGGLEYVLAVLDPETGKELSSEPMAVVGIVFDGLLDQWYIFEDTSALAVTTLGPAGPFVSVGDTTFLHTRELDTHSGKWTELGKVQVPAPYVHGDIVALNQRLAYVAQPAGATPTGPFELLVVDTSTPNAAADAGTSVALAEAPTALMGTRDLTGPGGDVTLLEQVSDPDAGADAGTQFGIQTVRVTSTGPGAFGASQLVASYPTTATVSVGAASYIGGNANVVVVPPLSVPSSATVTGYNAELNTPNAQPYATFTSYSSLVSAIAISECRQTAFVIATKDTRVYPVPLVTGLMPPANDPTVVSQGSDVRYEPYTNSVLVPFNSQSGGGMWGLSYFRVSVTGSTLSVMNGGIPSNQSLRPNFLATRTPVPGYLGFNCTDH
jgi:hypothetical protein